MHTAPAEVNKFSTSTSNVTNGTTTSMLSYIFGFQGAGPFDSEPECCRQQLVIVGMPWCCWRLNGVDDRPLD